MGTYSSYNSNVLVNQSGNLIVKNALNPVPTFTPAAGGSNVSEVTITFKDQDGNAWAAPVIFDLWLSDAATGYGLTAVTASGAVTVKTSSGTELAAVTAKKLFKAMSKADGTYILSITDTAKTTFYVSVAVGGTTTVSAQLVTGNYG